MLQHLQCVEIATQKRAIGLLNIGGVPIDTMTGHGTGMARALRGSKGAEVQSIGDISRDIMSHVNIADPLALRGLSIIAGTYLQIMDSILLESVIDQLGVLS